MAALNSSHEIESFVRRRIRRDWRDDITIGSIDRPDTGKLVVEIACRSRIACEQARISLAAFVANDSSDWKTDHWRVVEGKDHPFRLDLIEPRPEGY